MDFLFVVCWGEVNVRRMRRMMDAEVRDRLSRLSRSSRRPYHIISYHIQPNHRKQFHHPKTDQPTTRWTGQKHYKPHDKQAQHHQEHQQQPDQPNQTKPTLTHLTSPHELKHQHQHSFAPSSPSHSTASSQPAVRNAAPSPPPPYPSSPSSRGSYSDTNPLDRPPHQLRDS